MAGRQTEVSAHPVPPSVPAMLPSLALVGSRSCCGWCERAQPQLPSSPAGMPLISGSSRTASPVPDHPAACGAGGVSAAGCVAVLCPLQPPRSSCPSSRPQYKGWEEASCHRWGDSGQPRQEGARAQGIRLNPGTGPLGCARLLPCFPRSPGCVTSLQT